MANVDATRLEMSVKDQLSLYDILKVFNNPINEEQAWAICYQCANYFSAIKPQSREKYQEFYLYGIQALRLKKDGEVYVDSTTTVRGYSPTRRTSIYPKKTYKATEGDAIRTLGATIFKALDYGSDENEERQFSNDLETLICTMIYEDESQTADDEGIEKDAEEEDDYDNGDSEPHCTLQYIIQCCTHHLSSRQDTRHYKAVCRALVTEAQELISFLDKISNGQQSLSDQNAESESRALDDLQTSDWARLWVQIMRQLRQGVRLKKVEHINLPPVEYELTPFEILLEDIRSRRYALHKIMVNGELPQKVKRDAHNVILDFIRSRPPLKKAKDRKLKTLPPNPPDPRECLLQDIRSQPKLRPVKGGKLVVESSRTQIDSTDEEDSPIPIRKIIKPDFDLFLNNNFDETDFDDSVDEDSINRSASMSPLSPPTTESLSWQQAVVRDVTTTEHRQCTLQRRHTIMVCESPSDGKVQQKELPPLDETEFDHSPQASAPLKHAAEIFSSPDSVNISCCGVTQKHSSSLTNNNNYDNKAPKKHGGTVVDQHSPSSCQSFGLDVIPEVDKSITDLGSTKITELNATELMHVSWKTACIRSSTNYSAHCPDCRPVQKRWRNPVECLNLTLDEVTHIRSVLTKAELESLITQPTLYNQVAKSKVCFTCKKVKFSIFGEWGTKCKFCKRSVCSQCLTKMQVPTEHFKNIPVHTLSPDGNSPESKEAMKKLVSLAPTGSNPVTPAPNRKQDKSEKSKKLQRSQSLIFRPNPAKAMKGQCMNVCVDCKEMTIDIIKAGRTSIALLNQGQNTHLKVLR